MVKYFSHLKNGIRALRMNLTKMKMHSKNRKKRILLVGKVYPMILIEKIFYNFHDQVTFVSSYGLLQRYRLGCKQLRQ